MPERLCILLLLLGSQLLYGLVLQLFEFIRGLGHPRQGFFAVDFLTAAFFRCLLDLFLGLAVLLGGFLAAARSAALAARASRILRRFSGFLGRQALLDQLDKAAALTQANVRDLA